MRGTAAFNNEGASLGPRPALERVIGYRELEGRIRRYEAAADRIEAISASAARLLNCSRPKIALLESATRAEVAVMVEEAAAAGISVMTHAGGTDGIKVALRNGVRS